MPRSNEIRAIAHLARVQQRTNIRSLSRHARVHTHEITTRAPIEAKMSHGQLLATHRVGACSNPLSPRHPLEPSEPYGCIFVSSAPVLQGWFRRVSNYLQRIFSSNSSGCGARERGPTTPHLKSRPGKEAVQGGFHPLRSRNAVASSAGNSAWTANGQQAGADPGCIVVFCVFQGERKTEREYI